MFIRTSSHLDAVHAQPCRQALPRRAAAGLGTSGLSLLETAASSPRRLSSIALLSQTGPAETEELRVLGSCKTLWAVFNFG